MPSRRTDKDALRVVVVARCSRCIKLARVRNELYTGVIGTTRFSAHSFPASRAARLMNRPSVVHFDPRFVLEAILALREYCLPTSRTRHLINNEQSYDRYFIIDASALHQRALRSSVAARPLPPRRRPKRVGSDLKDHEEREREGKQGKTFLSRCYRRHPLGLG
jgi:hypothetical protein